MTAFRFWLLPAILAVASLDLPLAAQSVYPQRPPEPLAVDLGTPDLHTPTDSSADSAPALQAAIDRIQSTTHHGLVLVPSGTYRLGETVHVWAGIRLIGYGPTRPIFVLAANTPGFNAPADIATGDGHPMLWFTDEKPAPGQPQAIPDASEFTFYSAMANINFDLREGNSAAVAVRFNVAQHSFLTHMDFHLGSARAAIEAVGNQASDLHIFGGQFGIITRKTSPAWQFLLMDSTFSGQTSAAIQTDEAGFTLIRDRFTDVPVAIRIPAGQVEQLYGRDLQMDRVHHAVLEVGDIKNLRSEITFENVACVGTPLFVAGLGLPTAPAGFTQESFSLGLDIGPDGRAQGIQLHHREHPSAATLPKLVTDIPALPPMSAWVDVRSLGVKGDGASDDTAALQAAIDAHRTLFLPGGRYRLTGSLHLRPDSVLIGMSPFTTELVVVDNAPEFQGTGAPLPLLLAPHAGSDIVTGIGVATGFGNPRAAGVLWLAGEHSLLEDMDFIRGRNEPNRYLAPAALPTSRGGPRPQTDLDSQYPSLWIKDGGGGIFRDLWSHAGTSTAGLQGDNSSTPAVFYQISVEHHLRHEVRLDHVRNWRIFDLQTEEEKPDGADAVALDLEATHNVLFVNTYMYRVSRNVLPKLYAITAHDAADTVFTNVKVFSQTRMAFDNSVFDSGSGVAVRSRDFTHFSLSDRLAHGKDLPLPSAFASDVKLVQLATGFSNATSLAHDDAGRIYFTDAAMHSIYGWNPDTRKADLLAKVEGSPQVLGFASPSTLLIVNYEKSVVALDTAPGSTPKSIVESATPLPNTTLLLPTGIHNERVVLDLLLAGKGYVFRVGSNTARRSSLLDEHRGYFYAPGTSTALFAGGTWRPILQSSQLIPYPVGGHHLVVSEDDARTYKTDLLPGNKLVSKSFLDRGGSSVVTDTAGNTYLASDQVYIYDTSGRQTGILEIPERPSSLVFGGPDRRTLYIGARSSLYAIPTLAPGQ